MLLGMKGRGFTIVELLVVIAIMGILLTLGVVNLDSSQISSRDAERKIDVSSISQHLETYYTSGSDISTAVGSYPSTALVSNGIDHISQLLRDIDLKSITAPGIEDPSLTLISATNAVQTTAGVLPQPTIDQYVYQPITSDGTLCTEATPAVKALIVAGGGGGGANHGGGGGGGGVIYNASLSLNAQSYPIVVGYGGIGSLLYSSGSQGGNSSFNNLTAIGGGGGGSRLDTNAVNQATAGGSGGGGAGAIDSATSLPGAGKAGTAGQGFAGGNGTSDATAGNGGGGGGAGIAGGNSTGAGGWGVGNSGIGGNGLSFDISGKSQYYGGGGSGGYWGNDVLNIGTAGLGGGGLGGYNYSIGKAGINNTGGGGGGAGGGSPGGGSGGSGVVIIAYPSGSMSATGGTISYSGGYTIHTFNKNGNFVVSTNKTDCRKFNLYYRTESDNTIHIVTSRNQ